MEHDDDIIIFPVGFTPVDSLRNKPVNPLGLTAPELRKQQKIDSLMRPARFAVRYGAVAVRFVVRNRVVTGSVLVAALAVANAVAKVPFH